MGIAHGVRNVIFRRFQTAANRVARFDRSIG